MSRIAAVGEDLTGKVCSCSLGRVGVVAGKGTVTFANGDVQECWKGFGFDGNGLWCTRTSSPTIVLAEDLATYIEMVSSRPSNFLYGKAAVNLSGCCK
jgi:hypothetical protein